MKIKAWKLLAIFIGILAVNTSAQQAQIDPELFQLLDQNNQQDVLIILKDQVQFKDLPQQWTKAEKGQHVFNALRQHAINTQQPLIDLLQSWNRPSKSYLLSNTILSAINLEELQQLKTHPLIARIQADLWYQNELPKDESFQNIASVRTQDTIEWGIEMIKGDEVWDLGYKGAGVIIGGQDTGVEWYHPAIKAQYKGWNNGVEDHNYNWHDAIHEINEDNTGNNPCGLNNIAPCDDHNHGTHTVGTMIGEAGFRKIGVAPEASWIGCRNMERGHGKPSTYLECFEWFLAPTDSNGANPDPNQAPHVINNSWACPESEGCNPANFSILETAVDNLKAAGVIVVASAGNSGSQGCSSISTPAAIFENSFTIGATNEGDQITGFSSRGPVTVDGSNRLKPNVSAPGRNVYSCVRDNAYSTYSGTSMAGPHVAGAVALIISARPELAGQVALIEGILEETAIAKTTEENCGGVSGMTIPNNTYGFGRIDVLSAVEAALVIDINQTQTLDTQSAKVFPNPTNGLLHVNLPDHIQDAYIQLMDTNGRVVHEQRIPSGSNPLNLTKLSKGMYFYLIASEKSQFSGKLILQ